MCTAVELVAAAVGTACSLAHYGVTDDEGGALFLCLCLGEGSADSVAVVTVDGDDLPAPSLVLLCCVLEHNLIAACRELDLVSIVEHDQVVELEVTCQAACTL